MANRAWFNGLKAVAAAERSIFISGRFVLLVDSSITGTGTVTGTNEFQITGAEVSTGSTFPVTFSPESDPFNRTNITVNVSNPVVTFPSAGRYFVQIGTPFQSLSYGGAGDRNKVFKVKQWGNITWSSMSQLFRLCNNLEEVPDAPISGNLSSVTILREVFQINNLSTIPKGFLDNIINNTTCFRTFQGNPFNEIPEGLFNFMPNVNNFSNCFLAVNLTVESLSRLYCELSVFNTQNNVPFHGGSGQYDPSLNFVINGVTVNTGAARAALVARGWTITDGGAV